MKPDLSLVFKPIKQCIRSLRFAFVSSIQLWYSIWQFYSKTVTLFLYILFFQKFDLYTMA